MTAGEKTNVVKGLKSGLYIKPREAIAQLIFISFDCKIPLFYLSKLNEM